MAANHNWKITRLDTKINYQDTKNVVYQVHFSCTTKRNDNIKEVIQNDAITLDYLNTTSYIPFNQLTEAQVLDWVYSILTPEGILNIETSGEQQLEEFINPTITTPQLPWV